MSLSLIKHFVSSDQHYVFAGYVTNKVLDGISAGIEDVISCQPATSKKYRKIFSIYVEMLQNILFYSSDRVDIAGGADAAYGGIEIAQDGDLVSITAVNPVTERQHEKLSAIMADIAASTPEGIIASYKAKLMDNFDDAESRGGGLGYYDIARKSAKPLKFEFFEDADRGRCFKIIAWV
jgi:hypothetical protein